MVVTWWIATFLRSGYTLCLLCIKPISRIILNSNVSYQYHSANMDHPNVHYRGQRWPTKGTQWTHCPRQNALLSHTALSEISNSIVGKKLLCTIFLSMWGIQILLFRQRDSLGWRWSTECRMCEGQCSELAVTHVLIYVVLFIQQMSREQNSIYRSNNRIVSFLTSTTELKWQPVNHCNISYNEVLLLEDNTIAQLHPYL